MRLCAHGVSSVQVGLCWFWYPQFFNHSVSHLFGSISTWSLDWFYSFLPGIDPQWSRLRREMIILEFSLTLMTELLESKCILTMICLTHRDLYVFMLESVGIYSNENASPVGQCSKIHIENKIASRCRNQHQNYSIEQINNNLALFLKRWPDYGVLECVRPTKHVFIDGRRPSVCFIDNIAEGPRPI